MRYNYRAVHDFLFGEDVSQKSVGMTLAYLPYGNDKSELFIRHGTDLNLKSNQGFYAKKYGALYAATEALTDIEAAAGS